jgi:hypothetical protein
MTWTHDTLIRPAPLAGEGRLHYGVRLFLYVLEYGSPAVATLDAEACELARYGAKVATDTRGASAVYYARVAETERTLSGRARAIAAVDALEAGPVVAGEAGPAGHEAPHAGPMAPLAPVPVPRAPVGGRAVIDGW